MKKSHSILIVDDEPDILTSLRIAFEGAYRVFTAPSGEEGLAILRREEIAAILADQRMPGMTGAEFLRRAIEISPESIRMMLTAYTDVADLMAAINNGRIYRYIVKPWEPAELEMDVQRAVEAYEMSIALERKHAELAELNEQLRQAQRELQRENLRLKREVARTYPFEGIVGTSKAMQEVYALLEKVIDSSVTVLLTGETGTGKELIARTIHYNGPRKENPFIAQNCAALPEDLLESELFGHRKGAFTGAVEDKKGLFEAADGGTLFLDEIGETSPGMQVKLLRALQDGEIRRVGETQERKVDVRIIAATHRDLSEEIEAGRFREALYYRLSVFPIHLPPLSARREDIPLLATHCLGRSNTKLGRSVQGFTAEAMDALVHYDWPGNVRELENEVERAVVLTGDDEQIVLDVLSEKIREKEKTVSVPEVPSEGALSEILKQVERKIIEETLRACEGNRTHVAQRLHLSRWSLLRKMERLGIG